MVFQLTIILDKFKKGALLTKGIAVTGLVATSCILTAVWVPLALERKALHEKSNASLYASNVVGEVLQSVSNSQIFISGFWRDYEILNFYKKLSKNDSSVTILEKPEQLPVEREKDKKDLIFIVIYSDFGMDAETALSNIKENYVIIQSTPLFAPSHGAESVGELILVGERQNQHIAGRLNETKRPLTAI